MTRSWRRDLAAAAALGLCGCAPMVAYRGPDPAPGSPTTYQASVIAPADSGAPRPRQLLAAGEGSAAGITERHDARGDTVTVLLYGDNRPGLRVEYHSGEFRAVTRMFSGGLDRFGRGLLNLPLLLVKCVVPTLDGPRDLVTFFTRRPTAGGERRVLRAMAPFLPAAAVISTGDVVTDGRRGRMWEDFVAHHRALREEALYLAAPGNHERLYSGLSRLGWSAAVARPPRPERFWYAADLPEADARFVFLDSSPLTDKHDEYPDSLETALADEQLAWADRALSRPARYRFLVLHHPLISTGHYPGDWGSGAPGDRVRARRDRLLELCARHRVTAVLAGHEHLYHRVFVADSSAGGFWQVISGGGGAPPYPIDRRALAREMSRPLPAGLRVVKESARGRSTFHFCRLTFRARGEAGRDLVMMDVYGALPGGRVRLLDRVNLAATSASRDAIR